jgi:hypothetical protein
MTRMYVIKNKSFVKPNLSRQPVIKTDQWRRKMDPKDFMSAEWPRWVSGRGFYFMSEDSDDDAGWSESKGYYINYNNEKQLWALTISVRTVQKEEDGTEFEENGEENIGPHDLGKLREILATYEIEFADEISNEIIKRMSNPHLL